VTAAGPRLRRAIIDRLEKHSHIQASDRLVADALAGYPCRILDDIRQAAEEIGFKWASAPKRSAEEILAWKVMRQPKCKACAEKDVALDVALKLAMPEGFEVEQCACGRAYPRMVSEAEGKCPKCWRKDRDTWTRACQESQAEALAEPIARKRA
jgi:hypothetical protein